MEMKGLIVVEDDTRDGSPGSARPCDALEQIANRPIVEHVLDDLGSAGIEEVIVAASAAAASRVRACLVSQERRCKPRLLFVEQERPLDLAGALQLAAPVVGDAPCIVHPANGLVAEPLTSLVEAMQRAAGGVIAMMLDGPHPDGHLSPDAHDTQRVSALRPKRDALRTTGVSLFGPSALRRASAASSLPNPMIHLAAASGWVAEAGCRVDVLVGHTWRRYTGDPMDLLELNRIALDRLDTSLPGLKNNGNRIEGRVRIDERASVRASVIVGPTVIGAEASIADAYIGPYTSIGAGARLEGAEIERSIVGDGASITHVEGRLAASVVGRDARVFRDFSLPRVLRLRVGAGTEVAFC